MLDLNIYDKWNNDKKNLQKNKISKFFVNVREIWFTKMGKNIGCEEDGKENFFRPVLVLKKVGSLFFTVALTSRGKDENRFYHKFEEANFNENNKKNENNSYAILSQVKVMDKKRFTENMGVISEKEFNIIKQKLKTLLF